MADLILIRDLLVRAIIGVNDDERANRQDVLLNIALEADTHPAATSDDIADAVNYRTIAKAVIALVEGSQCYLVERLAQQIADLCLRDVRVQAVTVRVEKPGALRFARSVGVEIHRTQEIADLQDAPA